MIKNHKSIIFCGIILFLFFFIFFSQVHPVVVYDGDDWEGIGIARFPLPNWNVWNPIKVLPEASIGLVGYFSAYVIYPILGDYIQSITYVTAGILSLLITVFFVLIAYNSMNLVKIKECNAAALAVLLAVISFLLLKHGDNSTYLFYSINMTCYYHYVIPGLVNICLVLYMMLHNNFLSEFMSFSDLKKGLIFLWIYLAIFSNVLHSVILIAYASFSILESYFQQKGSLKDKIITNIKYYSLYYVVIAVWFVSLIMETHGGRSKQIGAKVALLDLPFNVALKHLVNNLLQINKWSLAFAIATLLCTVFVLYKFGKQYKELLVNVAKSIKINLLCMFSIILYIVVVCAKAAPGYAGRVDVQISFLFYGFIIWGLLLAIVIKLQPKFITVIPLCILVLFLAATRTNAHFRESTMGNINPKLCKQVDDNLIMQIQEADRKGLKEMTLLVPKGDDNDNWPHPNYMGRNISRTLYAHGLISKQMEIHIKADNNMTKIVRP